MRIQTICACVILMTGLMGCDDDSYDTSDAGADNDTAAINTDDTPLVDSENLADSRSPGCGLDTPLSSGNYSENINGIARTWMLDVPPDYNPNKLYRLIFVWHPLMGSASQVAGGDYNGLKSLSAGSTVFVAADGLQGRNSEAAGTGWWNVDGSDMALFETMLHRVNTGLCIDQERVFSTGFSFGGMMSYTIGYEFNVFRAVAPCSGDMEVIPYNIHFSNPLPIMAFHGDADPVVSLDRGVIAWDNYLARNNCSPMTAPVSPSPCVEYPGCDVPTIWCQFEGGHAPMTGSPQAIWDFFSQF
ncbi:MAG: hypothetical protein JXX14_20930 [Deltaproteobacteria bacterium]|nr:hypothetical protein [Deltaproteobacteria bacterium]